MNLTGKPVIPLLLLAPLIGFGAGRWFPPAVDPAIPVPHGLNLPRLHHPGDAMGRAQARLAALPLGGTGAAAAPTMDSLASVTPPPAPATLAVRRLRPFPAQPPVDVADSFSRSVSAVVRAPGSPRVILSPGGTIVPGQVYRDGWRLAAIETGTLVLRKGTQERRIPIGRPAPSTVSLQPVRPAVAASVDFTGGDPLAVSPSTNPEIRPRRKLLRPTNQR